MTELKADMTKDLKQSPAPIAGPLTAAMVGTSSLRIESHAR